MLIAILIPLAIVIIPAAGTTIFDVIASISAYERPYKPQEVSPPRMHRFRVRARVRVGSTGRWCCRVLPTSCSAGTWRSDPHYSRINHSELAKCLIDSLLYRCWLAIAHCFTVSSGDTAAAVTKRVVPPGPRQATQKSNKPEFGSIDPRFVCWGHIAPITG